MLCIVCELVGFVRYNGLDVGVRYEEGVLVFIVYLVGWFFLFFLVKGGSGYRLFLIWKVGRYGGCFFIVFGVVR